MVFIPTDENRNKFINTSVINYATNKRAILGLRKYGGWLAAETTGISPRLP